ncbi:hypothetical protein [Nonomuraea sp. NPDC050691]|uniref:hypothetical protein n=1 Tax=Nonomuraea sp. NPDC050691 TaxID=3155661 RepID=UPI00340A8AEE
MSAGSVVLVGGVGLLGGGPLGGVFATAGEAGGGDGDRGAAPGASRTAARALSPEGGDGPRGATSGDGVLPDGAEQDETGGAPAVTGEEPAARSTAQAAPRSSAHAAARSTALAAPPPVAPRGPGPSSSPAVDSEVDPATDTLARQATTLIPRSVIRPGTSPTSATPAVPSTSTSRSPARPSASRAPAARPAERTPAAGAASATPGPGGTGTAGQTAAEYFRARWGSGDSAARHLTDIRTIGGYLRIYTNLPESAANSAAALTLCRRGLEYLRRAGAAHPVVFVQARFGENGNPVLANILGPGDTSCRVTHPDPG